MKYEKYLSIFKYPLIMSMLINTYIKNEIISKIWGPTEEEKTHNCT